MRVGAKPPETWWLYVLLCDGDKLYVGIAKDVELRFALHRAGRGAVFTRLNRPVRILAREAWSSKGAALRAEYALKRKHRNDKLVWIREASTRLVELPHASAPMSQLRGRAGGDAAADTKHPLEHS